jgi:hypothetical protein
VDAFEQLRDLGAGGVFLELAALDELSDLVLGDLPRLRQAGLDEVVLDVLEHDWDAGRGDGLGDLTAHRSGADDGGLEDEHGSGSAPSKGKS